MKLKNVLLRAKSTLNGIRARKKWFSDISFQIIGSLLGKKLKDEKRQQLMYQHVVLIVLLSEVQKRPKDSLEGIEINDNNMSHRSRTANLTSLRGSLSSLRIFSSSKILPWYRCSQQSCIFWRMSAGNLWNDMYCSTCLYYKQRKKIENTVRRVRNQPMCCCTMFNNTGILCNKQRNSLSQKLEHQGLVCLWVSYSIKHFMQLTIS